jgi:hypothetical protein
MCLCKCCLLSAVFRFLPAFWCALPSDVCCLLETVYLICNLSLQTVYLICNLSFQGVSERERRRLNQPHRLRYCSFVCFCPFFIFSLLSSLCSLRPAVCSVLATLCTFSLLSSLVCPSSREGDCVITHNCVSLCRGEPRGVWAD